MEETRNSLPENAQRELAPGEEYKPLLGAERKWAEVTPYSVTLGLLMVVIFSAAAAYLGLRVGQVFEAAIPIAIIAVGLTSALGKKEGLGQNVIIQSIGGCSGPWWRAPYSHSLPSTSSEWMSASCRCSFPRCLAVS